MHHGNSRTDLCGPEMRYEKAMRTILLSSTDIETTGVLPPAISTANPHLCRITNGPWL